MTPSRPLLCYFGHHKCASTWIHTILDVLCAELGWRIGYLYEARQFGGDLPAHVRERRLDVVSYVNADVEHARGLPPLRGFHVIRDPRDLIVSSYFSHRNSHPTDAWPELVPHREALRRVPQEEGLLLEMEFSAPFLNQMASWDYGRDDVLELRQESFTADPYRGFLEVFAFLGVLDETHYNKVRWLPYLARAGNNLVHRLSGGIWPLRLPFASVPAERVLGVVWAQRFEAHARGRARGVEDAASHYRSGRAGDWARHFTPEHVEAFKQRFGDLVVRLGYESDDDWSLASAREGAGHDRARAR